MERRGDRRRRARRRVHSVGINDTSPNLRRRRRGLRGQWANPKGRTHLRVQRKAVDEAASRWRSAPAATTRRVMTSLRSPRSPGIRLKSPTSVRGARNLWEGLIYPRFPRLSVWVDRGSSLVRSPVSGYLRDLRARRYLSCQSVGPLAARGADTPPRAAASAAGRATARRNESHN